jgi:hypothetical protein
LDLERLASSGAGRPAAPWRALPGPVGYRATVGSRFNPKWPICLSGHPIYSGVTRANLELCAEVDSTVA